MSQPETAGNRQAVPEREIRGNERTVMVLSGGFVLAFIAMAALDLDWLSAAVDTTFGYATQYFGAYWQLLMLATFLIALVMAFSPLGRLRVGNDQPDYSNFSWLAMIMATLLAGGGVFWAAAEPIAHFMDPAPLFAAELGIEGGEEGAAVPALAQSFMHWGFLAWSILGALTGGMLMQLHYHRGWPLKPRTLLYPLFGERIMHGTPGAIVDTFCVIAVVAGTVGPLGFLGLQVAYGLSDLFGLPDSVWLPAAVLLAVIPIYLFSAITGLNRGIRMLSRFNVMLALFLAAFILLFGPTAFIIDGFVQGMGAYVDNLVPMATFREDPAWLDWWTVFFWGWFMGYGPLMAIFVARISRGRTIRQIVLAMSVLAPVATCFWFAIVGGSGIAFELATPGAVSEPYHEAGLPAAMMAIAQQLPFGAIIAVLFLVLTTIFVATTSDSMTYTISLTMSEGDEPATWLRVFWGLVLGVMAMILMLMGEGSITALQSFIVVTAVPVSLILLPSLWYAPRMAMHLADGEEPAIDGEPADSQKPAGR
ncbi:MULTISPECIES: BCCT family transporter [Halorhodospira]|uniref:BCCT family transporter n=1 Tax=Halorhodospira TaxID=85108 RepID=UPI001EE94690|nr:MULTISPECIES: BCCT family transporter [Halorhodospira]MCG5528649.1 BCCT family transporter [Halorhodospira halophila]MCG5543976.1 BCCT family transporter [Halorhodospira sp. 9628]